MHHHAANMPNFFIYFHIFSVLSWLSVSLCMYGLPAALISVIKVFVLIDVNTKMGVAGKCVTLEL